MEWDDLPDTPENRALLLRSRHILSWSINQMECARLYALGMPYEVIGGRLGLSRSAVKSELMMFASRIFIVAQWKVLNSNGAVVAWLHLHANCCIPKWEEEVATTDPSELPEELAKDHRNLPRWKVWEEAERLREREDPRAPSVRRSRPRRER